MPKTLKDYSNTDELHNPSSERARGLVDMEEETGNDPYVNANLDQAHAYANDPQNSSKNIKEAEETAGEQIPNQYDYQKQPGQQKKQSFTSKATNFVKRRGPLAFLGGILAGAFALIAFFGGPSLLLVHMSEIFGDVLDQQHPVLETRYRKVTIAKFENKTRGLCGNVASYKCRYGSFSERELKNLRREGVEVLDSEGRSLLNDDDTIRERGRPAASMEFDGQSIKPPQYQRALRTNAAFRNANILSMNTKFIGLYDKFFNDYFRSVKASKAAPYKDAHSDEERDERLRTVTAEGAPIDKTTTLPENCDEDCAQRERERAAAIDKVAAEAEQNAANNIRKAKPGVFDKIANFASPVGAVSDMCAIPMAIDAVGMGAKVIRNAQMVRYASTFLSLASMIKAGDAQPEDISYAGAILTKVVIDSAGNRSKAATDGFAFRNAAYGDSKLTESASMALGAGGLGGKLQGFSGKIYSLVGGKGTCKTLNNPFVQGGLALSSLIPGVRAAGVALTPAIRALLGSVIKSVAANVAASKILGYVIDMGIDMVSGVGADSKNMYGELAGDWIGSGTDEMFSGANGMGGGLPLTPAQAVALESNNNQMIAEYKTSQTATANPLDANNPYSLVGMTYQSLLKNTGVINSTSSLLLAPQKLLRAAFTSSVSSASAVNQRTYDQCEDYRYKENNIAASPLCHVVRGIPVEYINLDPLAVSDWLFARDQIDEDGAPISGSDYASFIDRCFMNKLVGEDEGNGGDGGDCQIKESDSAERQQTKGYYAVHFVDERLSSVAENGLPTAEEAQESTQDGSSLRLATFNIFHSDGQANDVWTARLRRSIDVLNSNNITVAGLQEARPNQQRTFKNLAGSTYDIYPAQTNAGGTDGFTPNPIVWNKNSFSLVPGSGQLRAITYDGKQLRHLAIVKLQDKTTGQQFWVMNTHDPADVRDGNTAQQRVNNANLYVKVFNELLAQGIPVYMTGDFNNRYSLGGGNGPLGGLRENLTYCILTNNGKVWDAWDAAQARSGPCPSTSAGPANNAVDHIFVGKDSKSTVSNFSVSPMGFQNNGSDSHDTIFVDITIAAESTTTANGDGL